MERKSRPDWAAAMPRWARLLLGGVLLFWIVETVIFVLMVVTD